MATTNFIVRHRPNRIGILVRPDMMDDLENAAALCCLIWGGIRNPIIPVNSKSDDAADELVRRFQVDALLSVADGDAIKQFMERHPLMRHPRMSGGALLVQDWRTKKSRVTYLDVLHAVDKYWVDEFKHASVGKSPCRLVTWQDSDPLHHLFSVGFGKYSNNLNLRNDFREGFLKGLRASEVAIDAGKEIPEELIGCVTPVTLTAAELTPYGNLTRMWPGGVYLGDSTDVADLTSFWNVRAAGNAVEFACLSHPARCERFVKAHLRELDEQPQHHPNIPDHIGVFTRLPQDKATAALKAFPTAKKPLLVALPGTAGTIGGMSPYQFSFGWETTSAFVEEDPQLHLVTLNLPEREFLASSRRPKTDQMMAVSIESHGDLGYPNHTLSPPFRPGLNEFYSRAIMIDPWSVRSEEGGIGVCTTAWTKTLHLRPIKHAAVIEALLGFAEMTVEPSQAGRLTNRLLDAVGGYESTRVFKIRGVRQLIGDLNTQEQVTRGEATKAIWNNGQFSDHEHLYIEPRDAPKLDANGAFDFLLKKDFFRAGLWLKCEQCRLESWLSLRQIDDRWTCEYCGFSNITSLHIRDRGDWHFRKSGLLAKDNNQEGAIPVVLSLLTLGRVLGHDGVLRMTSVRVVKGGPDCEIDFIAIRHRHGEIECAIGEAKAAGGTITDDDVSQLKTVAKLLRNAGIEAYLVFSKTADAFTPDELSRMRAAKDQGYGVILLTNQELEPYDPYCDSEKLPERYAHSLADMAANTEFRYFPAP
jgi:hypothetical protein